MDRVTIYPGAIPLETDLLGTNKNVMVALSKLSAAMLGTGTIANGFVVTPTGPASLQVVAAPGEIYSLQNVDGTAYSSIAADTTHQIVKQGILLDSSTLSCPAPTTSGQSINYLIEVAYQDLDSNPVVLPYYNASNPSQAYSGPANSGVAQNTSRKGVAVIQVKAGASAATGSQVTPAPDAGYIGLYVVTVAFGQTTITSGNISQYSGAPMLPSGLLQAMQNGATTGATDIGIANAYAANFTPAITALTDKMIVCIKAANANTTASTFTPAPGVIAPAPIVGGAHAALQGGEIIATGDLWLQWNNSVGAGSWILIDGTGGAVQVPNGSQSRHAVAIGQLAALGMIKTIKRTVITSGTTYTPSAGMVFCDVEAVGGGGGGGGAAGGSGTSAAGGGGGYGGYSRKIFTAAQIGASQTISIGSAGAGSAAGNNAGGAGGATTFGAFLTCNGGSGGSGSAALTTAGIPAAGGAGGTATGGDINIRGSNGFASFLLGAANGGLSGQGGSGTFGAGGYPSGPNGSGNGGNGNGSGGSGGASNTAGNAAGAPGSLGQIVIIEYCTQ